MTSAIANTRFRRRHRLLLFSLLLSSLLMLLLGAGTSMALACSAAAVLYAAFNLGTWRQAVPLALLAGAALLYAATDVPDQISPWLLMLALLPAAAILLRQGWRDLTVPDRAMRTLGLMQVATLLVLALSCVLFPAAAIPALLLCTLVAGGLLLRRVHWLQIPQPRRQRLSVMLICKNEADRLPAWLAAISGWADEIVVFDSGSVDGSLDLLRQHTELIHQTDWPGYGQQKQRALQQCSGDWVLSLDADEIPSASLRREIDAWLASDTDVVGFRIPWVSMIFGGPVYFGADGRNHLRLFRRVGARFDGADVHEETLVQGRVVTLSEPVYHDTFRDYLHLKSKMADYALIMARRRGLRRRNSSVPEALLRGIVSFALLYGWRLGVLDGARGLLMAVAYAVYTFDKYAALWVMRQHPPSHP